ARHARDHDQRPEHGPDDRGRGGGDRIRASQQPVYDPWLTADLGGNPTALDGDVAPDPGQSCDPVEPDGFRQAPPPEQDPQVPRGEQRARAAEADHDVERQMADVRLDDRWSVPGWKGGQTLHDGGWRVADKPGVECRNGD